MKKSMVILCGILLVVGVAGMAGAELIDTGNGFIYDDVLDITWMKDSNYVKTSGYDADGSLTFYQAEAWIGYLNSMNSGQGYGGFNNWRLPSTPKIEDPQAGEMWHLYYDYGVTSSSPYPFLPGLGTFWYDTDNPQYPGTAWLFSFWNGQQVWTSKGVSMRAWAVHDGGAPVPEPATMLLLGSGLAGLAGFRRKFRKS